MGAWSEGLPADAFVDVNGQQVPLREVQMVKDSPDLTTFVKRAYDAHREVGARIPVKIERLRSNDGTFRPNAEAVEKWRTEHLPKLYEAGILQAPPAKPEDYAITKPEKLADGIQWNEEAAKELGVVAHKHGIPKAAIPDLLALHEKVIGGSLELFKTDAKAAETELRREFPNDYDARWEAAKRLVKAIFKDDEVALFDDTGLSDHPRFLGALMRLAPLAASDSTMGVMMSQNSGGGVTREAVMAEVADIMNNPQNPRHKLYKMEDRATMEYVDSLYKKLPDANKVIEFK